MEFTLKAVFRFIAILEGVSYLLLLIATLIKHLLDNEQYVKAFGMPHGILFILYIILALYQKKYMKWDIKDMLIIMMASIIPFGTFYVDKKYLR